VKLLSDFLLQYSFLIIRSENAMLVVSLSDPDEGVQGCMRERIDDKP
jgi:hypothetical protein